MKRILLPLVLLAAFFALPDVSHALSCMPSTPLIGKISGSMTASGRLLNPATFSDSYVLQSNTTGEPIVNIDAYAILLRTAATTSTQTSGQVMQSLDTNAPQMISLPSALRSALNVQNNEYVAQGAPYYVCNYSLTAVANSSGKLRAFASARGFGSYRIGDMSIFMYPAQKLTCTETACTASVGIQINNSQFTLSPGGEQTFSSGPLTSIKVISTSVPDTGNSTDPAVIYQRDPWGLLTYAHVVMTVRDTFTPQEPREQPFFIDVPYTHPYATAIFDVKQRKYMVGNDDGTFRPDNYVNRAELTKILVASHYDAAAITACTVSDSAPAFVDVDYSAWFGKYVCMARVHSVVTGYPNNTFQPANTITFAEATALIVRAFGLPVSEDSRAWYYGYYAALEARSAVPPTVSSFEQPLTRGEVAYIISRLASQQ